MTVEKWSAMPTERQILMIGNEMNRYINSLSSGLGEIESRQCIERALELTDLTVECFAKSRSKGRLKELLRWRELFAGYYLNVGKASRADLGNLFKSLLLMTSGSAATIV